MNQPYILPEARASYLHWWKRESALLWLHYRHIPGYNSPRSTWHRRWGHPRRADQFRTVSHTTTFPDGSTETWEWKSPHGCTWRWKRNSLPFRKGHSKNVTEKGRRPDSFNRERKTRDFRHNDKISSRWPCAPHKWACTMQNRWDRRETKRLIRNEQYDQIFTRNEPRDTWIWD